MADRLTYAQLEGVWLQAAKGTQFATRQWAALMAAIAEAESGGNPAATNPTDNNGTQTSWGLWQISNGDHSEPSPTWNNPVTNAQLAIGKLDSQGLTAWGTYDSGAYQAFLSDKTTPDISGISDVAGSASAATAGAQRAAGTASEKCLWSIGWGGIPGTSWLADLFGGGGNVGGMELCLLSKSQARAMAATGLVAAGTIVGLAGLILLGAGATGILSALPGVGKVAGLAGGAGKAATVAGAAAGGMSAGDAKELKERRAQERHDEAELRKVQRRRRDSPAGPALRDDDLEPAPF